jgi:hypothetical protein
LEPINPKSFDRPLRKAFGISIVINGLMGLSGALGNALGLSGFSYISGAIAAPTAFLIGRMVKPSGQSIVEVAFAGVKALAFSIVFYTVVLWLLLLLWPRLRPSKTGRSKP